MTETGNNRRHVISRIGRTTSGPFKLTTIVVQRWFSNNCVSLLFLLVT
jgi:hypothetical protein